MSQTWTSLGNGGHLPPEENAFYDYGVYDEEIDAIVFYKGSVKTGFVWDLGSQQMYYRHRPMPAQCLELPNATDFMKGFF